MATQLQARRIDAVRPEPLVMSETSEGWKIYSTANPKSVYLVTGTQGEAACTCPDYANDPGTHCLHIGAALMQLPAGNGHDRYDVEERRAIQEEGRTATAQTPRPPTNGASSMLLKRSVSPDGRIDSLSIEFACSVADCTASDIQNKATRLLGIQSGIVEGFLFGKRKESSNGNGASKPRDSRNGNGAQSRSGNGGDPAVAARLVDVGGMNGKWGRRLFINVEVNGRTQRLFGKPEELVNHIAAVGYFAPEPFVEGTVLNIPCRVTTKPSPDGKFQNVDRVLPAESQAQARPRQ
jgi:hypothetical protein